MNLKELLIMGVTTFMAGCNTAVDIEQQVDELYDQFMKGQVK